MFLFDFFRSFLPLHNPIGFGASDFLELALILLLLILIAARAGLADSAAKFAEKTVWCMALLFVLPIALRLALLSKFPVPTPGGSDDYSYLLLADTFRHLHLANRMHPMHRFFETVFILQEPAYASIYSPGIGLILALGWDVFGHPWAGVLLAGGAFCALCYWMLRAWVPPLWALIGGLLAVCEFGPLNEWTNIYWGGSLTAAAGCLVFGSLPRLMQSGRDADGPFRDRFVSSVTPESKPDGPPNLIPKPAFGVRPTRDAALLGLGLGVHLLTRPYESLFLWISVAAVWIVARAKGSVPPHWRLPAIAVVAALPALLLTLAQAKAVTGSWTTIPYAESRYEYGVPTTFTWQSNPVPHHPLTEQQRLTAEGQAAAHGDEPETPARYAERWAGRVRFYRFYFLAPLFLALPFFLFRLREWQFLWLAGTILLYSLGTNFYPYFFPQYLAGLTCVFVLAAVAGLELLSRWNAQAARWILYLAGAHFLFWYGMHAFANENIFRTMRPYETWDFVNFGDPEGRTAVDRKLAGIPGNKLVFVRYGPMHQYHEWIHNTADIDRSPVVMALDLGEENAELKRYYPDRSVWLLEPDAKPVRLVEYK